MPRNVKRRAETLEDTDASADPTGLAPASEYTRWLKSRGVVWSERRVQTTREGVVAGWGCVATAAIKRGEELFRVPRPACLGAVAADADADVVDNEKDSQQRMALVLGEAATSDDWAPFVRKLTPAPCPWLYSEDMQRRLFAGTELEAVLAMKRKALAAEHAALSPSLAQQYPLPEYIRLCGLAASHANPWFGGCIAPFNTTLNYSPEPNVAFAAKGAEEVVGTATRKIRPGEEVRFGGPEGSTPRGSNPSSRPRAPSSPSPLLSPLPSLPPQLTQEYAEATSDFMYKYGFAPGLAAAGEAGVREGGGDAPEPLEEDVVSITVEDLMSSVRGLAATGWGGGTACVGAAGVCAFTGLGVDATMCDGASVRGGSGVGNDVTDPSSIAAGACGAAAACPSDASMRDRIAALVRAGAAEPSPWDGLGHVLTLELSPNGGGTARLVGAAIVLCAGDKEWQRAWEALGAVTGEARLEEGACLEEGLGGAGNGGSGSGEGGSGGGCRSTASADECSGDAIERGKGVSEEGGGGDGRRGGDDVRCGDGASALGGSDDDTAAATLIASLANADDALRASLLELAAAEGGDDGDPWPALLSGALQGQPGTARFPMAWAVATEAVRCRRAALEVGAAAAGLPEAGREVPEGWMLAARLRELERAILESAEEAVATGVLA
jgi:hypothetical protein